MEKAEVTRVSQYSNLLMITTTIHHIYGAVIYNTPWRLHVLLLSIPVVVITVLLTRFLAKREHQDKKILFVIYWLIILVASIGLIGVFEGIYNHAIKDLLFYGGASNETLRQLFPPPKYQMPNDFWFEFTGILQALILMPLTVRFIQLTKNE